MAAWYRTVATVRKNLFEGAILVMVVLFAMLGNWRAALINRSSGTTLLTKPYSRDS
jgi:Cu/Ag efflux pump CusA